MSNEEKLLSYLKRATSDLREARRRLREVEQHEHEPIAVVGMACRLPGGVSSPEQLWELLERGGDGVGPFPTDRNWDLDNLFDESGETGSYVREGGFVDGAAEFDAGFFGISPREALAMDPQQRLVLESAWETFERAGVDPSSLRGHRVGVYVGAYGQGYGHALERSGHDVEGHLATGGAGSVVSGRVAYTLGLEGPAVTLDTACSSSLVALHLGAQALRAGECDSALVGGATVIASPGAFTEFSRQRGLSGDGRCRPFAAAADGTGWSEGVALVLLQRLSDAQRDGREVLAVLRGSAVNQDGVSNGLTAPNGTAQQRVIRQALASAGLTPADVDAVEAHGTGTALGDPIEARALLATYGRARAGDEPLWLGSIKSNIGHTQATAGIAGVVKMVEALRRGVLPRTLHVDEPTPHVDWTSGAVALLRENRPWPQLDRPRRAAVSSFGFSGTNAHVVLEQAPATGGSMPPRPERGPVVPWPLSARDDAALAAQWDRLGALDLADVDPRDVGLSSATTRAALERRVVVVDATRPAARPGAVALDAAVDAGDAVAGTADVRGKVAFLFPGQGSAWAGMARELLVESAIFAERFHACAEALRGITDWDPVEALSDEAALARVDVLQPTAWAVMVSLAAVWRAHGVEPAAVVGHSQGEIAAAVVAGGLSIPDAARLVVLRSRALVALAGRGAMLAVELPAEEVEDRGFPGVSLAVVNSPRSTVVAGVPDAVEAARSALATGGVRTRVLPVDYASHSAQIDEVRSELLAALEDIGGVPGDVPFLSTVTGEWTDTGTLDAAYWFANLRRPVRYADAVTRLADAGFRFFVELSAHPTLTVATEQTLSAADVDGVVLETLRRDDGGSRRVVTSLAQGWVRGLAVDWRPALDGGRPTALPTYPFQRSRYWPAAALGGVGDVGGAGLRPADHPLLGAVVGLAGADSLVLTGVLSTRTTPWLAEHTVGGVAVLAATAFLELAIRAGDQVGLAHVDGLTLESPLALADGGAGLVQVTVGPPDDDGGRPLTVHARPDDGGDDTAGWTRHASGRLTRTAPTPGEDLTVWPPSDAEPLAVDDVHPRMSAAGVEYGPAFRGLRAAWARDRALYAEVALPDAERDAAVGYGLHPALLDAALHAVALGGVLDGDGFLMPFDWSGVTLYASGADALRVRITPAGGNAVGIDVADATGAPVARIEALTLRAPEIPTGPAVRTDQLYQLDWPSLEVTTNAAARTVPVDLDDLDDLEPGAAEVLLWSADPAATPADAASAALVLVQRFLDDDRFTDRRLAIRTRGSVAVAAGDAVPDLAGAAVRGLVRSVQAEHPGRVVLVDACDEDVDTATFAAALALGDDEPDLAVRGAAVRSPRLARPDGRHDTTDGPDAAGPGLDPEGTVLVTGATGALGALVARHLVDVHDVRRLLLVSRRGVDAPGAEALVGELEDRGAAVRLVACDVADRAAVAELLASLDGPLTGVVHAAAVLDDGTLGSLTEDKIRRVLAVKADGACHLDELTRDHDLAMFTLFSSAAGTVGAPGQGSYAAANAVLDALAARRRAAGLAGLSLAWGPWAAGGEGMINRLSGSATRQGVRALGTDEALALFDLAHTLGHAYLAPLPLELSALDPAEVPPPLRGLARGSGRRTAAARGPAGAGLAAHLATLAPDDRLDAVLDLVREQAAAVLGHAGVDPVDARRAFRDLGFDSLTAVELRNRLGRATGLRLPATLVFDRPNPHAVATHLLDELGGGLADPLVDGVRSGTAARDDDPVVVVGMGCRFPGGVSSPDDLWELVATGADAIGPFPTDRGWEDDVAGAYTFEGGFLDDVAGFDAAFFGISPREALAMDPQQRLLLETAWEALEHAGIDPTSLRGTPTGVFAGSFSSAYATGVQEMPPEVDGYLGTGLNTAVLSGRVSYTLGLEGPAVTIDTACSSSLVAMHSAAHALRSGECTLALAGGVTVLATPTVFLEFGRQGGIAPDGRSKPFGAEADGMGSAEGVGLVVLERLSDARRNGHPVLAVLRGSAVNQDGASNGLTAPNGPSQQRVVRAALAASGLDAADVDAVEAHGTGTALGDPIEAQALLATYGAGRDTERPLWLGSVKSNIGHTQAAAGVAGVIKMVQAMRHGVLPPSLHAEEPNPGVDWSSGAVALLTGSVPWPDAARPRRAGVSSFGISGTNAHVVLEQAPVTDDVPDADGRAEQAVLPLVVSAGSAEARDVLVERLRLRPGTGSSTRDVAWSLLHERATELAHRAVVLERAAADATGPVVVAGTAEALGRPVLVFPGQGTHWVGMARELWAASPAFADRMDECARALGPLVDWDLHEVLDDREALERVDVLQPATWAVMVSLAALWAAHGVTPGAVVGHSQGEIAAATVAGALSTVDAARVVVSRARAITAIVGQGGMASIAAPETEVRARLTPGLSVAAVNGPAATVVSGDDDELEALIAACAADGLRVRRLPVDYASHGPGVEALREELARALGPVVPTAPTVPMLSTLTGARVGDTELDADYWFRNLRHPVRFQEAVEGLVGDGHRCFVEVGPHPVLTVAVEDTALAVDRPVVVLGTLERDDGSPGRFLRALAEGWTRGLAVDWSPLVAGGRHVELPTYPFRHERFWLAPSPAVAAGPAADDPFWSAVEQGDLSGLAEALDEGERDRLVDVLPILSSWRRHSAERTRVDAWRYQVAWRPTAVAAGALSGRWIVVGAEDLPVAAVLAEHGAEVVGIAPSDRDGLVEAFDRLRDPVPTGVVAQVDLAGTLAVVQALGRSGLDAALWLVTAGGVAAVGADAPADPGLAEVWGCGRVVGLEHPQRPGGLLDLPAVLDARSADRVAAVLAGGAGDEDQLAVRTSGVYGRRLVRARPTPPVRRWTPRGTVLVTGGTGAIGGHVARWAATHGAEHIVLTGRRGPDAPGAAALVAELEAAGTRVSVVACDLSDRTEVAALVAAHAPSTVLHAAGVGRYAAIEELDPATVAEVRAAKVQGARYLDELCPDLDAFVLFSSNAGVWGGAGQGAYAAANAALDALAAARRARGGTATSIAWGAWAGGGMAAGSSAEEHLRRRGVLAMPPEDAVAAMVAAVERDETFVAVADVDWARFAPTFTAARHRPLLDELPEVRALTQAPAAAAPAPSEGFAALVADASRSRRRTIAVDLVRREVAAVLGHGAGTDVDPARAFRDMGVDSLTAVEIRNRLATATGMRLPTTLAFDHPTAGDLADHLLGAVAGHGTGRARVPDPGDPRAEQPTDDPIAIVGMACRFPGAVTSPEDLWRLVDDGVDALASFPADRGWRVEGAAFAAVGGFLDDAGGFDAGFFGISPREALAMDPQQRLLLETAWEAVERSGIDPTSLRGTRSGVFVGAGTSGYGLETTTLPDGVDGYLLTGSSGSVVSGRVSYALGLQGPAVTVDTACSSSLVAMHLAAQSLRRGESELALAGGVAVMATAGAFAEFDRQGGLAGDGRCKPFAEAADGTGWGEGVGLVVLEPLSRARAHGRRVLGLLRGSAVNSDGASNGLTAPNGPAQERVIADALADAGLRPDDVDVVEGHGTGTRLGDPIEARALLATFEGDRAQPLLLGSVKSNIGHTQAASGVAGLIKTVMALRYGRVPATLHLDAPTSRVEWGDGAVEVVGEARDWPGVGRPRRAGVSAFGVSGTNAHVVVEAAPAEPVPDGPDGTPPATAPRPVVLSATTDEALRAVAARLRDRVSAGSDVDVAAVARSAALTRAGLERRVAVLASDRDQLIAELDAVAGGTGGGVAGRVTGPVAGRASVPVGVVFTGQGAQRAAMGAELYRTFPVFAAAFDEACAALDVHLPRPLRPAVLDGAEDLDRTEWAQPALFAVEAALYRLFASWGVTPTVVAGHSVGEITAAHVAGVLSLDDAAILVAARARLMGDLPEGGAMLAVQDTEDAVAACLDPEHDRACVAAVNAPDSVVLSGPTDRLAELEETLGARGVRTRRLRVSHAFHSAAMDPMLAGFERRIADLELRAPTITLVSGLTGDVAGEEVTTARYWVRHVREAVRFGDGVRAAAATGLGAVLEIGPDAALTGLVARSVDTPVVAAQRRDRPEPEAALAALAHLWCVGVDVDWRAALPGTATLDLPTYPFQRRRFWLAPDAPPAAVDAADASFWSAVDRGDADALVKDLGLDGDAADAVDVVLPALVDWRRRHRDRDTVDGWRYRVQWERRATPPVQLDGEWWLVVPDTATAAAPAAAVVEDALNRHGATVRRVEVDDALLTATGDPGVPRSALATLLRAAATERSPAAVVSVLGVDARPHPSHAVVPRGLASTLLLTQAAGDAGLSAPLWSVTSGAVRTGAGDGAPDPAQSQVWGFGRVLGLEHPDRFGGLVDLPAGPGEAPDPAAVAAALSGVDDEDQVAVREGGLLVRRLVRAPGSSDAGRWRPRGTVLVTGGTGALGARVARWVVRHGAEHVVLASRRGPRAEGADALVAELSALGAEVSVTACDLADRDAVAAMIADLDADGRTVRAVVHAAGVGQSAPIDAADVDGFAAIVAGKAAGARHLDELLADADLDAFVTFSSISGTWGSGYQGAYAAGNAFLDALVEARVERGRAGVSIAWGPWAEGGMAEGEAGEQLLRRGLRAMDPDLAVDAMGAAIAGDDTTVAVADVAWDRFVPAFTLARPRPLISGVPDVVELLAAGAEQPGAEATGDALARRLADLDDDEAERVLVDLVRTEAAATLRLASRADVAPTKPFHDVGFDSLTALELRDRVRDATGTRLAATVVFDHPSPVALARHVREQLVPVTTTADVSPESALDRLAAAAAADPDERTRAEVAARLQALLALWSAPSPDGPGHDEPAQRFASATQDEVFDFIDNQLGLS